MVVIIQSEGETPTGEHIAHKEHETFSSALREHAAQLLQGRAEIPTDTDINTVLATLEAHGAEIQHTALVLDIDGVLTDGKLHQLLTLHIDETALGLFKRFVAAVPHVDIYIATSRPHSWIWDKFWNGGQTWIERLQEALASASGKTPSQIPSIPLMVKNYHEIRRTVQQKDQRNIVIFTTAAKTPLERIALSAFRGIREVTPGALIQNTYHQLLEWILSEPDTQTLHVTDDNHDEGVLGAIAQRCGKEVVYNPVRNDNLMLPLLEMAGTPHRKLLGYRPLRWTILTLAGTATATLAGKWLTHRNGRN